MLATILPGATIGFLGGGQLGRMASMSARSLGYKVQVMDPDPSCPARPFADAYMKGSWEDEDAASSLARNCNVVTSEIEQISLACLNATSQFAPTRPGAGVMGIVQDRVQQKNWLRMHNFPVGSYTTLSSATEASSVLIELGSDIYLKRARGGYDGRSQVHLHSATEVSLIDAWISLGSKICTVEKSVPYEVELSILVARSPNGEVRVYPTALNHHRNQVLAWSVIPSKMPADLEAVAGIMAVRLAQLIGLEGILAIEMFLTEAGELLINELAPRPHNSYHASERGCATSQFEQLVRAICGLPLGSTEIVKPTAISNLFGDLWWQGQPDFAAALKVPGVHLHLYEKHVPSKGRKMGHLSASASTGEEALELVMTAMAKL